MGNRTSVPVLDLGSESSRQMRDNAKVTGGSAPQRWRFEGFTLDLASRALSNASGKEVPLWRSEFALLTAFLRAPGRALSREQLLDAVSAAAPKRPTEASTFWSGGCGGRSSRTRKRRG